LLAGEVLDFLTHNGDTSLVGGIEFENTRFHEFGTVELFRKCKDGGCFAGSWGPVEEHMREVGGLEGAREDLDRIVLSRDFGERLWATKGPCKLILHPIRE
jgi:hypothetical protein